MIRLLPGVFAALLFAGCGVPEEPCPAIMCLPAVRLEVRKGDGTPVTRFAGTARIGESTFAFGCGGDAKPALQDAQSGQCDANAVLLNSATGAADVSVELTSAAGNFHGVVVPSSASPSSTGCQATCAPMTGSITVH